MWPQAADILLVEDDPNDAEMALAALRERNILREVVHVLDGPDALLYISTTGLFDASRMHLPKVILLDLKLKTVSGLDVLRQLKVEERTKNIPVVMFTSTQREIEMIESYHLGVNSYVLKPADYETYKRVVGEMGHYWLNINRAPAA